MQSITVQDVANYLNSQAHPSYQESYDNAGLMVGNPSSHVSGILTTLDITEKVLDEAIAHNCNMIVGHHPIIFKGLKTLTGKNYVERTVLKAIKNDIALYASHTNLDSVSSGVSAEICKRIGVENYRTLQPKSGTLQKITVFVPLENREQVMQAMATAGAGGIGNYSNCSFQVEGTGTFQPNSKANPHIGEAGKLERVQEARIEMIFPSHLQRKIVRAMQESHPYEEVAHYIHALENADQNIGLGMIGTLSEPMEERDFLRHVKTQMQTGCVKYTALRQKPIQKVAVCGGAGSFLRNIAKAQGADIFITGDCKHHEFFDADGKMIMVDIGHYESEQFTTQLLEKWLQAHFESLPVFASQVSTNPVNYLM